MLRYPQPPTQERTPNAFIRLRSTFYTFVLHALAYMYIIEYIQKGAGV